MIKLLANRYQKRGAGALAGLALVGFLTWLVATRPAPPASEIISRRGLHWHAKLLIDINGQKQVIPANIGIGVSHNPIHTHSADGVIHMEMPRLVRQDDLRLSQFFNV